MVPDASKSKVLVLYVGGTMGMKVDEQGSLRPSKGYLSSVIRTMPEINDELDMPEVVVLEYDELVDSSDMDHTDWAKIVIDIEANYFMYDGFCLVMGTDTLAYTASALSFMLENLGKPVIVTGSMIPFKEGYSDARRNLLISLFLAGSLHIPEVCVFFHDKLLRGNRSKKMTTDQLGAFSSPNFEALAQIGVKPHYQYSLFRPPPMRPFKAHKQMDNGIIALKLIPGYDDSIFELIKTITSIKAVILELYGTGNAPSRKLSMVNCLKQIVLSGKLIVVVSQCPTGVVDLPAYAVGQQLEAIGCVSGGDMTMEAVSTKLSYLFGRGLTKESVRAAMKENLRGELSVQSTAISKLMAYL